MTVGMLLAIAFPASLLPDYLYTIGELATLPSDIVLLNYLALSSESLVHKFQASRSTRAGVSYFVCLTTLLGKRRTTPTRDGT